MHMQAIGGIAARSFHVKSRSRRTRYTRRTVQEDHCVVVRGLQRIDDLVPMGFNAKTNFLAVGGFQ